MFGESEFNEGEFFGAGLQCMNEASVASHSCTFGSL